MFVKSLFAASCGLLLATGALAKEPPPAPVEPASIIPALVPENTLNLDLSTGGRVIIQLRPDLAPNHVERYKTLVRQGFYGNSPFHRVIEGFMAQGGDPSGTGTGGSQFPDLKAEFNALPHVRGAVSAARTAEPDTANSQFFIMFAPRLSLDTKYTVFGRVVSGMQYVDAIERGEPPANPTRVVRASIGAEPAVAPRPAPIAPTLAPTPAPTPVETPADTPVADPK